MSEDLEVKFRRARMLNVILGALAAGLLAVAVVAVVTRPGGDLASSAAPSATPASGEGTLAEQVARGDAEDGFAIGDPDAPVTVVQWTDFTCPYCAAFARDTLPTLVERYVDTGQVRWEFHDVAFFGDNSVAAAAAARAAAEQGLGYEYLMAVYAVAPASGHPEMPREKLLGFAEQVGVPDMAAFEAALDAGELSAVVESDTALAQQLGVTSVPFFVIGDGGLSGAQPLESFTTVIDEQLAAAG